MPVSTDVTPNCESKLVELARLDPFGPGVARLLGDLVAAARDLLGTRASVVNMALSDAQLYVDHAGEVSWSACADGAGAGAGATFCAHTVQPGKSFVVCDTAPNPRVGPSRTSLCVPLKTATGHVVGAMCVLADRPRRFADSDIRILQVLADQAVKRLEARADRHHG